MGFLFPVVVNAIGILVAASVVPGTEIHGPVSAVEARLVLGLVNAVVQPILLVLTLPPTLGTPRLFLLVLKYSACGSPQRW